MHSLMHMMKPTMHSLIHMMKHMMHNLIHMMKPTMHSLLQEQIKPWRRKVSFMRLLLTEIAFLFDVFGHLENVGHCGANSPYSRFPLIREVRWKVDGQNLLYIT